jgi:4-carboxymuconolactone decarboxylase
MSRVPPIAREDVAPAAQHVWDRIAGPRSGVRGPYGILMHLPSPALAEHLAGLSDALRDGILPAADRELAILVTARELGSRYQWTIHEPMARAAGAPVEAVGAILAGGPYDALAPREQTIVTVVQALHRGRSLPDDLYAAALAELGRDPLIELVALTGVYNAIAFLLLGFEVDMPAGSQPAF